MSKPKVVVFDADGVIVLAPEPFSHIYARQNGRDPDEIEPFFEGPFRDALIGKRNIKDLIRENMGLWQGDPDKLMLQWCDAENYPDKQLVELITDELKPAGYICVLATNQEAYRLKYVTETMFPGVFDMVFASCQLHCLKPTPEYFRAVLAALSQKIQRPEEIMYFDDSSHNVQAASQLGIQAVVYQSVGQVRRKLLE